MIINQISVFLENRKGQLVEITTALSKNNVDLRAINVVEATEYGLIRFIVDDYKKACDVLNEYDFVYRTTPVVVAAVDDKVGGLSNLLNILKEEDFNIEYMYSIFSQINHRALMVFRVNDSDKLENILQGKGYNISIDELGIK